MVRLDKNIYLVRTVTGTPAVFLKVVDVSGDARLFLPRDELKPIPLTAAQFVAEWAQAFIEARDLNTYETCRDFLRQWPEGPQVEFKQ